MIKYNAGDDIKLRLQVRNRGEVINPADVRWTVKVYTESRDKAVLCTHDDSGYSNCYVEDNYIVLAIDNPALVSGILRVVITLYYEDDDMTDGYRTETVMMREVESLSDSIAEGVADISVVGYSAYRIAVMHGFEGTEEEWLQSLKGEPGKPGVDGAPGRDGEDANIEGCNEAIERANEATTAAQSATADALAQAKYAKEQGDNAKGQGDYAKAQGDYAKSQGDATKQAIADSKTTTENAKIATDNANTAASNANTEATYAKTQGDYAKEQGDATKQAIADAKVATENANTAASNANTEATYAKTQGDYAKEQGDFVKQFISNPDDLLTYGVEIDTTSSSPTLKRIGNPQLHKSLPIQSKMKGCLLDDNGNVTKYLSDNDWVDNSFIDGTQGQVMVEIPKFYYKFETDGDIQRVRISEYPLSGYKLSNTMYVGAYEASLQRSTLKLCSVCNYDADYRGGGNQSAWDDTYRSLLGRPVTVISRINFRKYARNRNAAMTNWNILTYQAYKMIYWLYTIEYASLNCQLAYNAELTSEGYHQGGLGAGVTNWNRTVWNNFNGYHPFIPCGCTNSLGNGTGIVPYEVKDVDGNVLLTTNVPRYRGIENPFGHIWKFIDGINIRISPTEENGGDGLSKVYVCKDPSLFIDTNYDGYDYVGNEAREAGYVKKIIFGDDGEIMPLEVGGGTTSYFCDYHYTNIPTSAESLIAVLFGGSAGAGSHAGFAYADSTTAPSLAYAHIGSRLCFIK